METKTKATSTSYALKAFKNHLDTLKERELVDEREAEAIQEIYDRAVKKWLKDEFGAE